MTSDDKQTVKSCRVTFRLVLAMIVLDEIAQAGSQSFRQISEISGANELLQFMITHRTRLDKIE